MDIENTNYQNLEVKNVTYNPSVPNNKLAKLMYYLDCVFTVIESDIEKRYINYNNYYLLTKLEEEKILNFVSQYNIELMKELNLFQIEPDFVPINKKNEFYDISDEIFEGKIKSEVIIDDVPKKVMKVMVCKQSWIEHYYEEPLKEYENPWSKDKYSNFLNNITEKKCFCCGKEICRCECDDSQENRRKCNCPSWYICGCYFCPPKCTREYCRKFGCFCFFFLIIVFSIAGLVANAIDSINKSKKDDFFKK